MTAAAEVPPDPRVTPATLADDAADLLAAAQAAEAACGEVRERAARLAAKLRGRPEYRADPEPAVPDGEGQRRGPFTAGELVDVVEGIERQAVALHLVGLAAEVAYQLQRRAEAARLVDEAFDGDADAGG